MCVEGLQHRAYVATVADMYLPKNVTSFMGRSHYVCPFKSLCSQEPAKPLWAASTTWINLCGIQHGRGGNRAVANDNVTS